MVSLSCTRKGEPQGNLLHYITRRGAPSELINFPDYITCILKAHRNLECNDFVPNGKHGMRAVKVSEGMPALDVAPQAAYDRQNISVSCLTCRMHDRYTVRSSPGKPNQRKGQNEKFMNFAHFSVNSGVFPQENKRDSH